MARETVPVVVRDARCSCGQLTLRVYGEPLRVSVCHCLDCQRRSGSAFATQARFLSNEIEVAGEAREWLRKGDEGNGAVFSFCPHCGSTICYRIVDEPGMIAVPVGVFAEPAFPPPTYSVYECRMHGWVGILGELEHYY